MKTPIRTLVAALFVLAHFAATEAHAQTVPGQPSIVTTQGQQIKIQRRLSNGSLKAQQTFVIAGVCWNPTNLGENNNPKYYENIGDLETMKQMNANTVRIYAPLPMNAQGNAVLDACWQRGIYMIMVLPNDSAAITPVVNYFKNHPAILMFEVGNEWPYNYWGLPGNLVDAAHTVNYRAGIVQGLDLNHPVSSSLGHANDAQPFNAGVFTICGENVDVWGFNTYTKGSMTAAIDEAISFTGKPIYFSEFGTDAYDAGSGYNPGAQATKSQQHWDTMKTRLTIVAGGKFSGGCVFAFTDGWWKLGTPGTHNTNGITTNPQNYYDGVSHEEWYGVTDIYRNRRSAYFKFQTAWAPLPTY